MKNLLKNKITAADIFTAKNITRMAVFTAISVVLYLWVKFPLPGFPSWLDIQVSELPALLAGYMMGPFYGAAVIVLKCLIKMPLTSTAFVGEFADILMGLAFVLPASFLYVRHRSFKGAFISLAIGVGASTVMSMIMNWLVLVPMYVKLFFGGDWQIIIGMLSGIFPSVTRRTFYLFYIFGSVLPFNIIRCTMCAVLTFLVYKHTKKFFDFIFTPHAKKHGTYKYSVSSPKRMQRLAKGIAHTFTGGEVVLLSGDLGAGKTVFCKGIAKGLNINDTVVSPTFTLMNEHNGGRLNFYHIDAYRLADESEAEAGGLCEYIGKSGAVCAVEWWENISGLFDELPRVVSVNIIKRGDKREVTVKL